MRAVDPLYVLMPHTYLVRDYSPKLAARFGRDVISDCVRATAEGGRVTFSRRIFLGKIARLTATDAPPFAPSVGRLRAPRPRRGRAVDLQSMPVEVARCG